MSAGRVVIVGGGASGIILAARLLGETGGRLRVAIIEPREAIGAGLAYSTDEPAHLLNTRAGSMSAYPEDPDHFWRWLLQSGAAADLDCSDPFCFVSRRLYRRYLADLVAPWLPELGGDGRLQWIQASAVDVSETATGVAVVLDDGRTEIGQAAVLATGHAVPAAGASAPYGSCWSSPAELGVNETDDVLILGTGLSMIDTVVALSRAKHRGRILALSRHGLLPQVHRRSHPLKLDAADIPFGTQTSFLLHWLRDTVRWAASEGRDWRDVVDALRPHTQTLWQALPLSAKTRFIRHARTYWEVHRHRMPPEAEQSIRAAVATERLAIRAGRLLGVEAGEDGRKAARIRLRGGAEEVRGFHHVLDGTGILRDPAADASSLAGRLVSRGLARTDPLRLGLDVDASCALINGDGQASPRIFAVGPLTKARFWEITAIPDIRVQCASLAQTVAARIATPGPTREVAAVV
ncbi:FAD/NAD(P)-binding protein [Antarcticirhabdus aurantiaca]|uniref:FAD/NAD(P)-binding protein n=1 Tax=Antarcticirhabdus aurantiaca TaxID=2606717 RepID=A0ACD4NK40_9HYPH|nr:FAD/NAD(P)-binding protein [Antarcticirhabdus aurantiaca]WAJ27195.1 FAD/NAD(P)-binding protein [Jeongeuplla avenae]